MRAQHRPSISVPGTRSDIVTAGKMKCPLYPGDASGSVLTVSRPLIGGSSDGSRLHLVQRRLDETPSEFKNVWVENIHEYLEYEEAMCNQSI